MAFRIEFIDRGREPQCEPDPAYPHGKDVNMAQGCQYACTVEVPYPAKRCGLYNIVCETCGWNGLITVAGRVDDPKTVRLPCELKALQALKGMMLQ